MTDSFQESQVEKSGLQLNGQNLEVDRFHCDNWVWNSNDPSIPKQSGDSWMYPYQRTPMGNPYISPI